jgi:hypothetical protein
MLSLNSIILGGFRSTLSEALPTQVRKFFRKYLLPTNKKDLSLMIKMTPSFYLKKERKIAST